MYSIPCVLSDANIEKYLSCAVYYGVNEFLQKCDTYINENISCNNVFQFLRIADASARAECVAYCFQFIYHNFENCSFDNGEFCQLSEDLVLSIVKCASLNVHEEFLFSCLISYADVVDSNEIFSVCSGSIRFTSMSLEYFVSECALCKFLAEDVEKHLLLYLSSLQCPANDVIPNVCLPPRDVVLDTDIFVPRVQSISVHSTWQSDQLNGDRIQFECSQAMKLKAVAVYGLHSSSLFYNLSVHVSSNGELLSQSSCRLHFCDDEFFKCIRLKKCLCLESNKLYTLALTSQNDSTFFGTKCISSTMTEKDEQVVKITFKNAACGSTSTENGQFHGLLFCD